MAEERGRTGKGRDGRMIRVEEEKDGGTGREEDHQHQTDREEETKTGLEKEEKGERKEFVRRTSQAIHPALAAWHSTGIATSVAQSWEARWCVCVCDCVRVCVCLFLRGCACVFACVNNRSGQMEQRRYRPVPCRGTHTYKPFARARTHTLTLLHSFHNCLLWQTTQFHSNFTFTCVYVCVCLCVGVSVFWHQP